jgi:4-hydroxysphinganine ceramide fatty acyl 2-hydroxylase
MCINKKNNYYSQEDINNLNNNHNCKLIIVNNNVYDITSVINFHPGGKECILNKLGKDCSKDLSFHSKQTKQLLKKFYVGKFKK